MRALADEDSGPVHLRANAWLGGGRRRLGGYLGQDEERRVGLTLGCHLSRRVTNTTRLHGGGCFFTPSADVTTGQIFLNEIASSFVLLFLAFGLGLDPRQAMLFGPRLGPLLVGVALGLTTFASSGMIPGYTGANMNPGRCLSLNLAGRDFSGMFLSAAAMVLKS